MTRIPVILNPRAGVRNIAREEEIRAAFASHGISAEIKNAGGDGDFTSLVRACVADRCPVVVVGGGDGSLHSAAGADLFLSGHLHVSHTAHTADRYEVEGRSALVIHAGTAISTRRRDEGNSFNVLYVEGGTLRLVRFDWNSDRGAFLPQPEERYARGARRWEAA